MSRLTTLRCAAVVFLLQLAFAAGPAPVASATEFGLSDQQPATWSDPRVRALGLKHARLIVPWDAATSEPARTQAWLDAVAAAGLTPHIVFERLRSDRCPDAPCVVPSRAAYRAAIDAFRSRFPQVTTFTTWNEVNHFTQPVAKHPEAVAGFWVELTAACQGCTIVAGDVLDSGNYLRWLERFKVAVPTMPQRWGIHNYADVSYGTTTGTDSVLAAVPGELWVEETGGIVTLRDDDGRPTFGTSETRAAASIDRAFAIARGRPRITRMYVYHWKPHTLLDTFDAGLVGPDGTPRMSLQRMASNLAGFASTTTQPVDLQPQVNVSARWSTVKRRELLLRLRCVAAGGVCRGAARVAVETRRSGNARMRRTRVATSRTYATTRAKSTVTIRLVMSDTLRARIRAAKTRRLAVTLTATKPVAATGDSALKLPRPARR